MARSPKAVTRLYVDSPLDARRLELDTERAHYLGRVLRCREGQTIVVFNAEGRERDAVIESLAKRRPSVMLGDERVPLPESSARIILLQALIKSDAMDLVIQKATELGVAEVRATRTEYSVVRLDDEREARRIEHWRRIARSACEQSGRHRPPVLSAHATLDEAIAALPERTARLAFDPRAETTLTSAVAAAGEHASGDPQPTAATDPAAGQAALEPGDAPSAATGVCLAIGPEGGFSPAETVLLGDAGFTLCTFGPRTLRAETAAIAGCSALQLLLGDLG